MIERVKLTSYSPDTDENNPAILIDSGNVYSTTRGLATVSVPESLAKAPRITYATDKKWYGQPVGSFNATWINGQQSLYLATERVVHPADTDGTKFINGGIFIRAADGSFTLIYYKDDSQSVTGAQSTVNSATNTLDLVYDQYVSIDQYGDYVFFATGGAVIYVKGSDTDGPNGGGPGVAISENNTSGSFTPKFVARAGNFVFLSCGDAGEDAAGLIMDQTYWRCSVDGVLDGTTPDFRVDTGTLGNSCVSNNVRETPGPIIGMKALDRNIIIYKENSVFQLSYVGPPVVWSQFVLTQEAGALSNNAVVDIGGRHVFMGRDDFYYVEGQSVRNLPNPVKEFLLGPNGDIDKSRYYGVLGHFDKNKSVVFWYYPSNDYSDFQVERDKGKPVCDKWVSWNFLTDTWTRGEGVFECRENRNLLVDFPSYPDLSPGNALTYFDFGNDTVNPLSGSTVVWNTNFANAYNDPAIVGSFTQTSGLFTALATNESNSFMKVVRDDQDTYLSSAGNTAIETFLLQNSCWGVPITPANGVKAYVRTGDFGDGITYKFIRGIRPVFSGKYPADNVECTVFTREDLDDDWKESASTSAGTTSLASTSPYWLSVRSNSRYHQFKLSFTGMAEISSIDIDYDDMGLR